MRVEKCMTNVCYDQCKTFRRTHEFIKILAHTNGAHTKSVHSGNDKFDWLFESSKSQINKK